MSFSERRGRQTEAYTWPGFVDALSSLLLVLMFVIMIFVVGQFYLSDLVTGKDKSIDLFKSKIQALSLKLGFSQKTEAKLRTNLKEKISLEKALREKILLLERDYTGIQKDLETEKDTTLSREKEIALLNEQLKTFNDQIQKLTVLLKTSEEHVENQKVEIHKFRINAALLQKVEEMEKYRSEFFARLQKTLGNRKDIRIEGDRFVFQSEVLFDSASATLETEGEKTIDHLSQSLKEIITEIPKDVNWVLRIDGHTDKRPISSKFRSNWELSFARAMAVVRRLIKNGIPANRLVATGFGEHYPLVSDSTEEGYKKNRRIEIKLDQR